MSFVGCLALIAGVVCWLANQIEQATAEDLNGVVALAGSSADAKMAIAAALAEDLSPTRSDVRAMRIEVSEILAAEKALGRSVDGAFASEKPLAATSLGAGHHQVAVVGRAVGWRP